MKKEHRKNPPTKTSIAMGKRIRERRNELGITAAELAASIGVTSNAISQYETGRSSPKRERASQLVKALGKSINWLLTGNDPEEEVKAQTKFESEILKILRDIPSEKEDDVLKILRALKQ